jgi:hypothetical protein
VAIGGVIVGGSPGRVELRVRLCRMLGSHDALLSRRGRLLGVNASRGYGVGSAEIWLVSQLLVDWLDESAASI